MSEQMTTAEGTQLLSGPYPYWFYCEGECGIKTEPVFIDGVQIENPCFMECLDVTLSPEEEGCTCGSDTQVRVRHTEGDDQFTLSIANYYPEDEDDPEGPTEAEIGIASLTLDDAKLLHWYLTAAIDRLEKQGKA